jgi:toxin ParE1/3/4
MNVTWSPLSIECVSEIAAYIAHDKPSAARNWVAAIFNTVKKLEKFPELGRKVPEINRNNIREIIFKNYRIIYRVEKEQISILTVRHGKQILPQDEIADE